MILEKVFSVKINKNEVKKMGSVIYLHERNKKIITELEDITSDDVFEKQRLESIRDGVESMLSLITGIRKDPEAVALSSARFGIMRMCHLYGRAETIAFVGRCIDTVEMAEDVLNYTP